MPSQVQAPEEQVLAERTIGDEVRREVEKIRVREENSEAIALKFKKVYEELLEKNRVECLCKDPGI
jgi:hypothetical protein